MFSVLQQVYLHCCRSTQLKKTFKHLTFYPQGFRRVYDALPDISLDVPSAYTLMERFAQMCHRDGVITTALYRELPQRSAQIPYMLPFDEYLIFYFHCIMLQSFAYSQLDVFCKRINFNKDILCEHF